MLFAIDVLKWPGVNQAFLVSFFGTLALALAVIPYGKRRPVDKKASWGEAMLAATYAFFVMFLAFGVVPHQWIDHADKDLGWTKSKIIYGPSLPFIDDPLKPRALGGWVPLTLQYEAVRDTIVVLLHVIFFGLIIFLWKWWQTRGDVKPGTDVATSPFGRPLVRKG